MQGSIFPNLLCSIFIMNKERMVKTEEWKISLEEFLKRIAMDLNETFHGTSKGCQGIPQIRIFHEFFT